MNRFSLTCGFAIAVLWSAAAADDAPSEQSKDTTIQLDQIWGYNLPGTRDISGMPLPEGDETYGQQLATLRSEREQHIEDIRRALSTKSPTQRALPSFVYPRLTDFYALRAIASQVLRDANGRRRDQAVSNSFPAGEEFTLVFFSHPTSYYVRLKKVERQSNTFVVHYQFEPHTTPEATVHFALIPLSKLAAGEYHVDFRRVPEERKYLDAGFKLVQDSSTVVCDPFSFKVFEPPVDEPRAKDATLIPLDHFWAYDMPGTINVRELESKRQPGQPWEMRQSPLTMQILESLHQFPKANEKAGSAFVVLGTGKEALTNAHAIFTKQAEPQAVFPSGSKLSLVFYSFTFGRYVQVASVEQSKTLITVNYRFVSHATAIATTHFAIIPLGQVQDGEVQVKIRQLPPTSVHRQKVTFVSDPQRIVCDSFVFRVGE
jgi:hypothetical protein